MIYDFRFNSGRHFFVSEGEKALGVIEQERFFYGFFGCWQERRAKVHYYDWARRPHGNAPAGTPYAWALVVTPSGKRERLIFTV